MKIFHYVCGIAGGYASRNGAASIGIVPSKFQNAGDGVIFISGSVCIAGQTRESSPLLSKSALTISSLQSELLRELDRANSRMRELETSASQEMAGRRALQNELEAKDLEREEAISNLNRRIREVFLPSPPTITCQLLLIDVLLLIFSLFVQLEGEKSSRNNELERKLAEANSRLQQAESQANENLRRSQMDLDVSG